MPNVIEDGAAWLADQLQYHAGTAASYKRGSLTVTITVTRSPRLHQVIDEDGFATQVRRDAWIAKAADLVLGGATITPRAGDRLVIGSVEYELMPPDGSTPAYEPEDQAGQLLLLHTKRVT